MTQNTATETALKVRDVVSEAIEFGMSVKGVAAFTRCSRQQVWLDRRTEALVDHVSHTRCQKLTDLNAAIQKAKELKLLPLPETIKSMNSTSGIDTIVQSLLAQAMTLCTKQAAV